MTIMWCLLSLVVLCSCSTPNAQNFSSIASIFDERKIHVYFLSGGDENRTKNCLQLMKLFGLGERHYDFVLGPRSISQEEVLQHMRNGSLSPTFNQSRYGMGITRYLCQLGKIRVIEAFLASRYEQMILFEDDVTIADKYNSAEATEYLRLMLEIPADSYDMQFLGYCFECYRRDEKVLLNSTVPIRDGRQLHYTRALMPLCNHAVLFQKKAAKAFVKYSRPFRKPGDVALTHVMCKTGHVNDIPAFREAYSPTPPRSGRCFSDSDVCTRLFDPIYARKSGFGNRMKTKSLSSSVESFYNRYVKRAPASANPSVVLDSSLTGASTFLPTLYRYFFGM